MSDRLGSKFSGNGDLGGFIVDVGKHYPPGTSDADRIRYRVYPTRGPLITSYAPFEADGGPGVGPVQTTVEDGGIPPTLAAFTRVLLNFAAKTPSGDAVRDEFGKLRELDGANLLPKLEPLLRGKPRPEDLWSYQTEQEMLENVFYLQCMGKDEPDGRFSLDDRGRLNLKFAKDPMKHPVYRSLEELMRAMATKMGGHFVPFTSLLPRPRLFTLHPLGGCPVGRDVNEGVVDEKGRIFKNASGGGNPRAVYEGLYMMDASIFPGPVAVNPTLTIVALALRIADGIRV